jgi:hypothetical protein
MESIRLKKEQRAALVRIYIEASDAVTQRRAQCLLLLDDGYTVEYVEEVCNSKSDEVAEAVRMFRQGGTEAITG